MKGLGSTKTVVLSGYREGVKYEDKRFDFINGVDKVDWPPLRFALTTNYSAKRQLFYPPTVVC